MDHAHRDHPGFDGLGVAADDGLKRLHQLAGHRYRVQRIVRHGSVTAFAVKGDFEVVARCHHGTGTGGEMTDSRARPVVQAKHRLHRELLKQPVLDHLAGTATAFFCWLENQVDRAVKVFVRGQVLGGCQQHGGVPVVAAGVHFAGLRAGVSEAVGFVHRQGVHIGAQTYGPVGRAVFDDADHTGGTQPALHRDTPRREFLRHDIGRALFFKAQLGVGVNVATQGGHGSALLNNFWY
ncbi:hypothetical protein GALL_400220 [mine drainage metagenome]|uniref:Uncharacterized protein n=1 Tax=mine drainage metagenome TaxID=410659 RepID=A0A1J5Q4M8_9ZZZZ